MNSDKVFIIAEAGVNHNGDLGLALKMVEEAKKAGVDAIKFQTFKTSKIVAKNSPMAKYQQENCGSDVGQFEMLKQLELSYDEFKIIKDHCEELGLMFLSTPDEEESLEFLVDDLKMGIIKIGSGEINNLPYLRKIGSKNKDVIMSTGMSTLSEVASAIKILEDSGAKSISLLHCTTEYPAQMQDVNLNAMLTLQATFQKKVGYSDHTLGFEILVAAVAMGARIVEKHFTLDKNMIGPDHKASIDPFELADLVKKIRNVEAALGDGIKKPCNSELANLTVVRKSIVASCAICKNEVIKEEMLTLKRPGDGLSPMMWDQVIGTKAIRDFREDEQIDI